MLCNRAGQSLLGKLLVVVVIAVAWFFKPHWWPAKSELTPEARAEHSRIAQALREIEELVVLVRRSNRTVIAKEDFADILRSDPNHPRTVPSDPWKKNYQCDPEKRVVFSCGPDGKPGTKDDIKVRF